MRLSNQQHQSIKNTFIKIFKQGEIYLFGSRVDDNKKGGDIDLYIVVPNLKNLMAKRIEFLVELKREIGNQKIDIVFDKGEDRLIDRVAKEEGVLL